ncbi:MAG TPA: tetratricopeptide repeat protein [Pirellulales bacterium]|nr:tetratricopeptide repeat protein [Pirellulales bacterium]
MERFARKFSAACLVGTGAVLWLLWHQQAPAQQFGRAMEAFRSRDWERVQYGLLGLKTASGYESRAILFSAALHLQRKEFGPALEELELAAAHPDVRAAALTLAGEALYGQGKLRPAEKTFRRALEVNADEIEAHRWLAIAYYDIGLMTAALGHLQRVADLDPHDPRPHRIMGVIHMDHGNPVAAVDDFEESVRRDPAQPDRDDILLELGQCQRQLHRYDDARRTLSMIEESADSLALLADIDYHQNRAAEAGQHAREALKLAADQRLALLVLGKIAFDERRFADAVETLTRAARAAPKDYDIHYALATSLRSVGRNEEAEEELHAAEELHELGRRAEDLFQQATADPEDAGVRYQLGMVSEQLGLDQLAETWFKAAALLAPNDQRARARLAELKQRGGQWNGPLRRGVARSGMSLIEP